MAYQSFEEKIKDYDSRKDIHYYVYFSSASYTYCVDVLQFKKKSDIKNEFYKDKIYYSTYAEAKKVADKLNEKDTDVGHLFGRAASEFGHKVYKLLKMGGMTDAQKHAIEAAYANVNALTKLINDEHF